MNAPTGKLTGIHEFDVQLGSFHRMRSELLDSFADIEKSLIVYVSKNQPRGFCVTAPLGHKIEAAKQVPAGPQRSKDLKVKADQELAKLTELLPLRADIVHSRMEVAVTCSSDLIAIFRNAKDERLGNPEALVFNHGDLMRLVDRTKAMAKSLSEALAAQNAAPKARAQVIVQAVTKPKSQPQKKPNPASSPPRPTPDAKARV
jgi:hypothetical protein